MAKLVDALVSGTSVSNDVQVRVLFWAPPTGQSAAQRARSKRNHSSEPHALGPEPDRPDGEIGRHASLRGWCRLRCASSSLVLGTKKVAKAAFFLRFAICESQLKTEI